MGHGLRLHGRLGRIRHARLDLLASGRTGWDAHRHRDRHGHHAGDRQELLLFDETQFHNGRRVLLCQRSVWARSCLLELMVSVPIVSDHRIPQRHGAVHGRAHPLQRGRTERVPLRDCREHHLPGRSGGFHPGARRRRRALRRGETRFAKDTHGSRSRALRGHRDHCRLLHSIRHRKWGPDVLRHATYKP